MSYDPLAFQAAHQRFLTDVNNLTDDDLEQFAIVDPKLAERARARRAGFVEATRTPTPRRSSLAKTVTYGRPDCPLIKPCHGLPRLPIAPAERVLTLDPQSDPPRDRRWAKVLDATGRKRSIFCPLASTEVHRLSPADSS